MGNGRSAAPSAGALALLLAGLAMLGPFSVDTYLPAFAAMGISLQASALEVQQTLTAYMLAFSVMILWHGALSDTFGRRRIILISLALYAAASLVCALAPGIGSLWFGRVLQGVSAGAGIVIGRAIIRDLYDAAEAQRMLSLVTMIFAISPAIAPLVGGWIVTLTDWRAIFLLLTVIAVMLLLACLRQLPETLAPADRQPFHPVAVWRNYRQIFLSPRFQLKAGAIACNFSGLFLYVASAPAIITGHLHLGAHQFGWMFVPSVAGIFLGSLAANRMAGRTVGRHQIRIGFALLMTACLFNTGYHLLWPPALPWTVAPLFLYTLGMSMVAPALTLKVLDLFPHLRGTVASCQSFTMTMLSALIGGLVAPWLSDSTLMLAIGQAGLVMTGLSLWLIAVATEPRSSSVA